MGKIYILLNIEIVITGLIQNAPFIYLVLILEIQALACTPFES